MHTLCKGASVSSFVVDGRGGSPQRDITRRKRDRRGLIARLGLGKGGNEGMMADEGAESAKSRYPARNSRKVSEGY
jgi:hypothetical protein